MNNTWDMIAAWPWAELSAPASFVYLGVTAAHAGILALWEVPPRKALAWMFLWPIVTPLWLITYPVRWLSPEAMAERAKLWADEPDDDEPDRSHATRITVGGVPEKPVTRGEFEALRYTVGTSFADAGYVDDFVAEARRRLAALEGRGVRAEDERAYKIKCGCVCLFPSMRRIPCWGNSDRPHTFLEEDMEPSKRLSHAEAIALDKERRQG